MIRAPDVPGTEASNILAAADLDKMKKLKEGITSVGNKCVFLSVCVCVCPPPVF